MKNKTPITLVMIVKNEENVLPRLIDSLVPHISKAVIHDTGSSDNTIQVIKEKLSDIPCVIRSVEWKSFGENRTNAINDPEVEGYALLSDADFEYFVKDGVLDNLTADGYFIPMYEDSMVYSLVTLVKAGMNWQYVGKTHEYLDYTDKNIQALAYDDIHIKHHHDGGSRSDKFVRDLKLLLEDYNENPENYRTVFYLAQTYECLGQVDKAIEWYLKRVEMGGWEEEVYIAKLRAGKFSNNLQMLLEAYSYRPIRLEALYEAALRLRNAPNVVISLLESKVSYKLPSDVLFVEKYIWDFALKFELAQAYRNVGRVDESNSLFSDLLKSGVPKAYEDFILSI